MAGIQQKQKLHVAYIAESQSLNIRFDKDFASCPLEFQQFKNGTNELCFHFFKAV